MPGSSGLHLVTAPRLEPLFEHLADHLATVPLPLTETETLLVAQNVGMRAWLTKALAERLGCAAALDLGTPLTFATDLAQASVRHARPDDGERHPFDGGPLAWRLAPLLSTLPDDPVYAPLAAYLDRTDGQTMPLASRIAALFDDYQVYRPDVMAAWADGHDAVPTFAHSAWQRALWQRLVAQASPTLDRAAGILALADRLRGSDTRAVAHLPTRVLVFGSLLFPPIHLRVLVEAARHIPVTVYAVTPGDSAGATHRHPMLRALAGRSRDFWTVLASLTDPDAGGGSAPVGASGVAFQRTHLPLTSAGGSLSAGASGLRQLQAALASDTPPEAPVALDPSDRSLRVHDCHSPTRELEALRDSLLDAFADLEGLRPSDVLVIVPDLGTYAPLVDAVFGAEDAAPELRIPYHVAEHPHAPAQRVAEAFGRALRLQEGRVTASDLLDLLGTPVVRRAAGIEEDELPRLRAWVKEAGVCWGLTAERKSRFDLPADDLHTWRFGLDRLLLGVMTGEPEPGPAGEGASGSGLVLGHLPCDVAGLDGADLLGRFCEWAEALFSALDALDRPARLDEWPDRVIQFLDGAFRAETEDEIAAIVHLRQEAQELARLHRLAGSPDEPVSFRTVRAHLDGASDQIETREPYLTGRVTIARPVALRHAPYRVVAFLGLNDGVYPAPDLAPDIDLIGHQPRPGDADARGFDKQLFVDAVMAARDRLILSSVGRSQKDNAERAASVCLDAFLDAARRHWGEESLRQLVVEHRLQPFAADYFSTEGPLASYASQHRVGAADPSGAFFASSLPAPADEVETLTLAELADAWTNPSRFVVRRRLRASLDLDDGALRDDEPIELNALERFHVRDAALAGMLDGLSPDALAERLTRGGQIPGGASGASVLAQACEEAEPIAAAVLAWGATDPLAVALDVEGVQLVGTLARTTIRGALRYRAGAVRERHLVAAWIDHLALCASRPGVTCTVGADGSSRYFEAVTQDDAQAWLAVLVRGYKRARQGRLPLYEKASHAYAKKMSAKDLEHFAAATAGRATAEGFRPNTAAMAQARRGFSDTWNDFTDDADAYVALATRGLVDPFSPEEHFAKWALGLWAPLLTHVREGVPA
ncbi:MAG: exodeoxyribonuclease V subunit gamma [Bacteroidota bacterium]